MLGRSAHSPPTRETPAVHAPPQPPPSGLAYSPREGSQPPGDRLSPLLLGSFILPNLRGAFSLSLHVRVGFAPLPSPLPGRQQPPAAHLSRLFRPLTQFLHPPLALGRVHTPPPRANLEPLPRFQMPPHLQPGLRPPRPGRAPRSTWPPLPLLGSAPLPPPPPRTL